MGIPKNRRIAIHFIIQVQKTLKSAVRQPSSHWGSSLARWLVNFLILSFLGTCTMDWEIFRLFWIWLGTKIFLIDTACVPKSLHEINQTTNYFKEKDLNFHEIHAKPYENRRWCCQTYVRPYENIKLCSQTYVKHNEMRANPWPCH